MITKFKIFENNNDKKMFYHIIKNDDFEKFYKKIKKSKLNAVFFEIPEKHDEVSVICNMSDYEKTKYFRGWYWGEDLKISTHIMINFQPIDPEKYMKEWEIRKQSKKYNL